MSCSRVWPLIFYQCEAGIHEPIGRSVSDRIPESLMRVSWKCREDLGPNYILLLVTSMANLMLIMLMPVHIWELILQQEANSIVCSITELQERIAVTEY